MSASMELAPSTAPDSIFGINIWQNSKTIFASSGIFATFMLGCFVRSYEELRNQSHSRQNLEESCGAASATLDNTLDFKILTKKRRLEQMDKGDKLNTDMVGFCS